MTWSRCLREIQRGSSSEAPDFSTNPSSVPFFVMCSGKLHSGKLHSEGDKTSCWRFGEAQHGSASSDDEGHRAVRLTLDIFRLVWLDIA
jgi:hypothetical protein